MSDDPLAGDPGWIPTTLPHLLVGDPAAQLLGQPVGQAPVSVRWFKDEAGALVGKAWFGPRAEGPPGHAHGGSMAAVLDEAMGGAAWIAGHPVLAGEISVRFERSLPLLRSCRVSAAVGAVEGRKVRTSGRLVGPDGTVHATATGTFLTLTRGPRAT
ncbi:MAG: PaaI family thioesterase [Myxococcales bacterium]|nr:PaaI family thioesterase [Myxococcales bacterium]MCB1185381.1 PaaI family thioesterase [bacterium]MCB9549517.1 PaaI family thioesterase [Myxococcales bacterium]